MTVDAALIADAYAVPTADPGAVPAADAAPAAGTAPASDPPPTVDVVIAGGGPSGLLLACELQLAGVRPLLLERLPERSTAAKANGLVGRVVRALEMRGLYERLAADRPGPVAPLPCYQFGGLPLNLRGLPGNPLYVLQAPQTRIEQVLEERARELGVEIRRGHELTALHQGVKAVTLDVRGPAGGYRLRARHLVGADGGHSLVRRQAGIPFPGTTDDGFVSRAAHVVLPDALFVPGSGELDLPDAGLRLPPYAHNRLPGGVLSFAAMPPGSGVHLLAVFEWDRPPADADAPMTFGELRASVRRVLGADLPMDVPTSGGPHLLRRVAGVNSRQAQAYRTGRVLLLGDAAHVHSAVGGPGLNLGLLDAVNLGWKLAAEVRGWAPPGLLDTYESERAPAGRRVLMQTRAQLALLRPGPDVTATRDLLAELLGDDSARARVAALLAGTDAAGAVAPGADPGHHADPDLPDDARTGRRDDGRDDGRPDAPHHPLVGRWLPDLLARSPAGSAPVAERLRAARPLLLDLSADASAARTAGAWRDRVEVIAAGPAGPDLAAAAVLVRPDGYVVWAADQDLAGSGSVAGSVAEESTAYGLRTALTCWFGTPIGDVPSDVGGADAETSPVWPVADPAAAAP